MRKKSHRIVDETFCSNERVDSESGPLSPGAVNLEEMYVFTHQNHRQMKDVGDSLFGGGWLVLGPLWPV